MARKWERERERKWEREIGFGGKGEERDGERARDECGWGESSAAYYSRWRHMLSNSFNADLSNKVILALKTLIWSMDWHNAFNIFYAWKTNIFSPRVSKHALAHDSQYFHIFLMHFMPYPSREFSVANIFVFFIFINDIWCYDLFSL